MTISCTTVLFLFLVACVWQWGEYGSCSVTCGRGTKTRYPIITKEAQYDGYCPLHVVNREPDTADCEESPCPGELTTTNYLNRTNANYFTQTLPNQVVYVS